MLTKGQRLGEFEIIQRLGQGGMGDVYKARQISLERFVALKTLQSSLTEDEDYIARFRQEARAAAVLSHPNLVQVISAGESEGLHWFAMEYVAGESARERLKRKGRLDPREAIAIAIHTATALDYGWRKAGLIHRDIKPENIFLSVDGEVKLGDLGLAKSALQTHGITTSGAAMGTPRYMSPEQAQAMKNVDLRADIYSLGCTLYHLLSGMPPYDDRSALAIIMKHANAPVPDLRTVWPECPAELAAVVAKMMQKQAAARPQSYEEVNADLRRAFETLSSASVPSVVAVTQKRAAVAKKRRVPMAAWAGGGVASLAAFAALVHVAPWKKSDPAPVAAVYDRRTLPAETSPAVIDRRYNAGDSSVTPATATKDAPFVNTLGMKFVPVPILGGPTGGKTVLFSVWDTRVQDYEAFVKETKRDWPKPDFEQGPTHPAVMVSWDDAQLFCQWLTAREQAAGRLPAGFSYRLPSDHEWSCAVGIGVREDAAKLPSEKDMKIGGAYPWGSGWPPPKGAGNYAGEEMRPTLAAGKYPMIKDVIPGYDDGFVNTSPVGSFATNLFGLYDMGGNIWQWCADLYDQEQRDHVLRGASWFYYARSNLLSSDRAHAVPGSLSHEFGFRCVLAPALSPPPAAAAPVQASGRTTPTPAPSATPKPMTEVEKWLAEVDGPQQAAFQKQVLKPFATGVAELRARYLASLDAAIAKASAAGQLADALAWRTERQAFELAQNVAADDDATPAGVKSLRAAFRQQLARLDQDRMTEARALLASYDAALAKYQTLLTQRQRLDDALLLNTKRTEIARAWMGPPPATALASGTLALQSATKDQPFVNTLGMKFVPVPILGGPTGGQRVLFSVWDTRVQDYEVFVKETKRGWPKPDFEQGPTHPAVNVSWEDAQLFCQWLTGREQAAGRLPVEWRYRLPSDHEWSCAVGIGAREDPAKLPSEKDHQVNDAFPWGAQWPPPKGGGNYAGEELRPALAVRKYKNIGDVIAGYNDGFENTSPVGSFAANQFGLYDMGGNVWQWCEDWRDKDQKNRVMRGASWFFYRRLDLQSSCRVPGAPDYRNGNVGFRCVLGASAR